MPNPKPNFLSFYQLLCFVLLTDVALVASKSTIEPCSNSDSCNALLGYTLYTDLKVAEVASLFQVDPISVLTANAIDISYPDVENHILPSQLFVKIPILCSCVDGIRKSVSTHYKTRPQDTLSSIADSIYACASNFPKYASDHGLIVPNGSYAITASHCVQCSCGPGSRNLYCMPASLAVSCSSMQCKSSNLMLGNVTVQQSSAGCNVTSCAYSGYANGTIITSLSSSLQPRCPGPQQFPPLVAPPTYVTRDSVFAPAPAPQSDGATTATVPKTSTVPSTGSLPGFPPAGAPFGSLSNASTLMNSAAALPAALVIYLLAQLISPLSL
ncbi:hypothetical protein GOBAR_AA09303 [Gossypium barbadense]|uniref:LysM domain-containing protein n=1 Tax=Gossypium barbadense TaxID=3634 RepID=A0A2P5Y6Y2_GOSBA|nr:hypothetical protein GOBAR_AA09303 [Gossypium barbadense]